MKKYTPLFLLLFSFSVFAQNDSSLLGLYSSPSVYYFKGLHLNKNKTFLLTEGDCTNFSETYGDWIFKHDTLTLLVYDSKTTLASKTKQYADKLLSLLKTDTIYPLNHSAFNYKIWKVVQDTIADIKDTTEKIITNWKEKYLEDFNVDPNNFQFITADSVFVHYMVNEGVKEEYTDFNYHYMRATQFAEKEMQQKINTLNKLLNKPDAANFTNAQKAWQTYYNNEWNFIKTTCNEDSWYHHKYPIIKQRVLDIEAYIYLVRKK